MVRVCFVCLGNICRSPTAEAVFTSLVREAGIEDRFVIDSAGTSGWHVGEAPDPRAVAAARQRGVRLERVARATHEEDFRDFDLLVAMDRENVAELQRLARDRRDAAKIVLLRDFEPGAAGQDVPDPYYEGGFDRVFRICERACRGLLEHLRREHGI